MAMSAVHRSKFAALHRQWWRLQMSEKFSSGTKNYKQTNKQTNKQNSYIEIAAKAQLVKRFHQDFRIPPTTDLSRQYM